MMHKELLAACCIIWLLLYAHKLGVSLLAVSLFMVCVAAQDIVLERIEPAPGQLPCPSQIVMYECRVLVPAFTLQWTLPNGDGTLEFLASSSVDEFLNSSDGIYSATLTKKTDAGSGRSLFSSTLLILEPSNGTNLTCGAAALNPVMDNIDIIISGEFYKKISLKSCNEYIRGNASKHGNFPACMICTKTLAHCNQVAGELLLNLVLIHH